MLRYFQRIEDRAHEMGNHHRKYTHVIRKHGRSLIDILENSGRFDRVHLRNPASDIGLEMDAILDSCEGENDKLIHLGTYYAVQYLLMNIRAIDRLTLTVSRTESRMSVYRDFIHQAGDDFEVLIREYLKRLLDIFIGDNPCPEYVICTVGTRLHQDDVDLGIIDDGSPARVHLNKAIGKMAREMVRWASVPDFYLSEHVGSHGYIVSIDEYRKRLDRRILDFISVTEILSAYPIIGSDALFERFKKEIHNRYYYRKRKTIREHEGYVRGLIGEIESLLIWPQDPDHVNPKHDLLRLISGTLAAYRSVYRIKELDPGRIMRELDGKLRKDRNVFRALERSYTFVETFRHLYQQFSAQEEDIDLTNPNEQECLQKVASAMGFEDTGVVLAWEQLLVHYLEYVKGGRKAIRALVPGLRDHIKKITIFGEWVRNDFETDESGERVNLGVDFLKRVRYFHGIKHWDDLLEALEDEENDLLKLFLQDLQQLDAIRRQQVINYYAYWGHQTFYALLRLLVILGKKAKEYQAEDVFHALNKAFLESVRGTPDEIRRFSTVFIHYPELIHEYLMSVDEQSQHHFYNKLSAKVWDPQVAEWQSKLLWFCEILLKSSLFFKRAISRAGKRNRQYFTCFGDLDKLDRINQGILADLVRLHSHEEQREMLGAYYDVQFLRIGLATLQGRPLEQLDAEFTEFADFFLQLLFDICKTEVDARLGTRILTHDLLAVFVAGGHARERAHQDDYDLIVLLNSDDEEIYEYSSRIIALLNREISRRGIMPQYRLADRFGGFISRFSEVEGFLNNASDDAYVEMSQLVGARMIVGSGRLEKEFTEKIIHNCIYSQKKMFSKMMVNEIYSRHKYVSAKGDYLEFNIKEGCGGLRDLEMAMLIYKVLYEIRDPLGGRFWDVLDEHHSGRRREFLELKESYQFLNRLRDVYRLSVAPQNRLDPNYFDMPAEILGYRDSGGKTAREKLIQDYRENTKSVAEKIDALIVEVMKSAGFWLP